MQAAEGITEENKIMMMLVRIGDENTEKIDSHIQKLCSHLCTQIEVLGKYISDTLLNCVSNIPNKPFVYAFALYTMAEEEHENVSEIVKEAFSLLCDKINEGSDATLLMKFFGALADSGYLTATAFEQLLKNLLEFHSKAVEQNKENDYFLNLALAGYYFGRRSVRDNVEQGKRPEIETILETHINNRPTRTNEYNVFKSVEFESGISQMWSAILLSYKDNILFESKLYDLYLRPSRDYIKELEEKNISKIESLPEFKISGNIPFYKSPGCFELFGDRCTEASNCDKATYAISRDLLRSTLLAFQGNPFFTCQKLCGVKNVPMLANLIFDVIFDELLRLPISSKKSIYYASICVTMVKEFTREDAFEFGPVVGEALQLIFGSGDHVEAGVSTQGLL